jgi:CheY-like chemotaxis protein
VTRASCASRRTPGRSDVARASRPGRPHPIPAYRVRAGDAQGDPEHTRAGSPTPPSRATSGPGRTRSSHDEDRIGSPTAGLVLVVDDNPGFRGLAARILHGWGYDVIEAGTVADAVACVVERRPHTVLVDIGLPDGDGFGLTQQLVALPSPPRVVLISTDADAGNRSAAYRVGAVGFVPKDELLGGTLQGLIDG